MSGDYIRCSEPPVIRWRESRRFDSYAEAARAYRAVATLLQGRPEDVTAHLFYFRGQAYVGLIETGSPHAPSNVPFDIALRHGHPEDLPPVLALVLTSQRYE